MELDLDTEEPSMEDDQLEAVEVIDADLSEAEVGDGENLSESDEETEELEGDEHTDGELTVDAQDEEHEEQSEEKKLKIFISYNQNPNDSKVATRIYAELHEQYDVFWDQAILPATDFGKSAEEWLGETDFVIALISPLSLISHWVTAELEHAFERSNTEGRPIVIPVRIAYSGPYSLTFRAYIGRFQAIYWDNENYVELFEKLKAGLSKKPLPITEPLIVGADIIPIRDELRKRYADTFVEPRELTAANVSFAENKLLWVTGDAAVRNYVALAVAARTNSKSLYEITKFRKWSEINNTNVSDATIVLRDALPAPYLNDSGAIGEWHSLRAIIERNNIIIATAPDIEFERLTQELLRYQFTDYEHLPLGSTPYTEEAKRSIFTLFLDHMFNAGDIDDEKFAWASELVKEPDEATSATGIVGGQARARALERRQRETRGKFRENISRWSPADIERFALSLTRVKNFSEVAKLLQRNAVIEDEIRSWFIALDDSTRCFVLTLSIFPQLDNDQLWDKYKIIVEDLRRFDPGLRLLPFGICRQRAQPNVSIDGPIYLADERVADAIRGEVGRSYREYFIELTPKFKEWSVPLGRDFKTQEQRNQRKPQIEETREARNAIARMVGIAGRLGLDDLLDILDYWATDSSIHIRNSVGLALEQTARSQAGAGLALNLVEEWSHDIKARGDLRWRALTAAKALGNVTAAANDLYITLRALNCLRGFARSQSPVARFYAAMALKQIARHAPLSATAGILSRLAKDDRPEVSLNVAAALNEARLYDAEAAATFSEQWMLSDDPNRRWVALCGVVTSRNSQFGLSMGKYQFLLNQLEDQETATILASVFGETVADDHYGQVARDTFSYLVQETKGEAWSNLASGLGAVSVGKLEKDLLPLLRFPKTPPFDERAIDVRREVLKYKLRDPARFWSTLKSWLNKEQSRLEAFRALTQLVDDAPDSCQSDFVTAIAEHFSQHPSGVNEMLATLEDLAPAYFGSLARTVRNKAFKRLLQDPMRFLTVAGQQLAGDETFENTRDTLESLVQDEPPGTREEMLGTLLDGYAQAPDTVKTLLLALKSAGSSELVKTVYEFNYRLIEAAISAPATFPSLALEVINSDGEALSLLNYLAAPEPEGRRSALVGAIVESKLQGIGAADELLTLSAFNDWTNLASLPAEVSRRFYVRKIFSRKFVTKLFRRR